MKTNSTNYKNLPARLPKTILLPLMLLMMFLSSVKLQAQTATAPAAGDGTEGNPYQIATLENLYWISVNLTTSIPTYCVQTADIDASSTSTWTNGWIPIGSYGAGGQYFWGSYNGQGHVISNLYIGAGASSDYTGLFRISNAVISNLGLTNVNVTGGGGEGTGALAGYSSSSPITNCYSTGSVTAPGNVGGLIGKIGNNEVTRCFSSCTVTGTGSNIGGFIGTVLSNSEVTKCYATGSTYSNSSKQGGFVGESYGIITNCYATGNSYSTAPSFVGGFVGWKRASSIGYCYSTGTVPASGSYCGGFSGYGNSSYCLWDTETSGTSSEGGSAEGRTTAEMKTQSTFTDSYWNFETVWGMITGINNGYPYLQSFYTLWTGTTSSDWNTAGNWSTDAVPIASSNVTINATVPSPVIDQAPATPALCNNLTISAGGLLSINPGKALTVNGTLNNIEGVAGLSIESDAANGSGSLLHYTADVPAYISTSLTGSATLTEFKYHLVSVPLTPSSNSPSSLFQDCYLYNFDVANNIWHGLGTSTTTDLDETKGYMVYFPGVSATYFFDGNLNAGEFTSTVIHAGSGYNLVPNPYPSSIDWNAASGWTKANIDNATWIWNSSAATPYGPGIVGNYAAYVAGAGTNGGSRYIAPGQAFFVKTNAASPVLKMSDAVRLHNATPFLKSGESIANLLRVKANANNYSDEAVVRFTEGASQMADANFDAEKMFGLENAPQLYTLTQGNEKLSINSLPAMSGQNSVPLSFETQFTGVVNLTFANMESFDPSINIYLKDELTNQTINLRNQAAYTFNHNPANDANRFKLIFGGTYGIEENESLAGNMWVTGNTLYINTPKLAGEKAKVEVYNAAGQSLLAKSLVLDGLTFLDLNMQGFVIVKLTSGQAVLTTKGVLLK